jgi:hypothetical protein
MSKAMCLLILVVGATVGATTTWLYAKKKYELIAQSEIDSVKEVYSKRKPVSENTNDRAKAESAKDKPDLTEYAKQLKENGYINYSYSKPTKNDLPAEDTMTIFKPYVISPDNFGEYEDEYTQISLIYYADQVLTDEDNQPIEDIEDTIGIESLSTFGEYEADSVFVRNDRLKTDFEILLDQQKYADVIRARPNRIS